MRSQTIADDTGSQRRDHLDVASGRMLGNEAPMTSVTTASRDRAIDVP